MKDLKAVGREIKVAHPEVKKILLFGSLARNNGVPGSDADLLMILSFSDKPFLERIPEYLPSKLPVAIDVFPYTQKEINNMLAEGNTFIKRAMEEGIELA
jgi:predicted nucleotidyltransferase